MKKFIRMMLASFLIAGSCYGAGVTDLQDLCTGPNEANCIWKVSATGSLVQGATAGASNLSTTPNSAIGFTVLVSTAISQGMAMVVTAPVGGSSFVNGVMATTTGATSGIGVADTSASSGTVVTVDYSGTALALTTGTITVGDILVSTATWPGYLVTNNSAAAGAIYGTALTTQAATYNGLTRILVHH